MNSLNIILTEERNKQMRDEAALKRRNRATEQKQSGSQTRNWFSIHRNQS